jgi:glycosyltransferase involved in cell wall biosynthesis
VTVSYFYRTPTALHSIERVFEAVRGAIGVRVRSRAVYCRYRRGIAGYLYNLIEARSRQSGINHITGDVHYLALALDGKRTVLTIHDCGTLDRLTGWRREVLRLLWFEWPARRAAAVTVISGQTRAEVLRWTSCPEWKIRVIPDPLPPGFEASPAVFCAAEPKFLQIGTRANKNLENAARALEGLRCHLTIVGSLSVQQASLLDALKIRYTAFPDVTDAALLDLYRKADIVLFCSLYEGFGMPIIESNALGRPVVASDIEPLRDVAGGSTCLVNPRDVESIRAGVRRLIGEPCYRDDLIRRGFANAARFDARNIAAQYLNLYEEMLAGSFGASQERPMTVGKDVADGENGAVGKNMAVEKNAL